MRGLARRLPATALEATLMAAFLTLGSILGLTSLARASSGVIEGFAFLDSDADGTLDAGEVPLADQQLYLLDASGTYLGTTLTDMAGTYRFTGLADGGYAVTYAPASWMPLRDDWVPTTTPGIRPEHELTLSGHATADFGWRRIARSSDPDAPISTYVGPSGLTVKSYTDAVSARGAHDLTTAGLVGAEAATVVVHVDLGPYTSTSTSVAESGGVYSNYRANVYISWGSWLDGAEHAIGHEYGHAWSLFHAFITHGDPALNGYLEARGLSGDPRVDSGYLWHRRELIAEDYRQLLGGPAAAAAAQANGELPPASAVPGLREFLVGPFVGGEVTVPAPSAEPTPGSTSTPVEPSPTAAPEPTPVPTPASTAEPTATPAALQVRDLAVTPTPVTKRAEVSFELTAGADVRVAIHDAGGALIRTLADGPRAAGRSVIAWDRKDDRGRRVRAGTYVVRVDATGPVGDVVRREATFAAG